ncbi:hypothetical protein BT63DRAFT_98286 [Microthyrium microscopicum]|uniref:Lysophospholipase n=1 Tax=Microthyrium microscopicum TaxID=703497 RepID=A0A6A6TZG0_9PEZI|nr:hypothetical protein BT63DRAFT_98286 [Microthyrium microscopicum]
MVVIMRLSVSVLVASLSLVGVNGQSATNTAVPKLSATSAPASGLSTLTSASAGPPAPKNTTQSVPASSSVSVTSAAPLSAASSTSSAKAAATSSAFQDKLPSYAPKEANCGFEPLVRPARGLSRGEQQYVRARKRLADRALKQWLDGFDEKFSLTHMPTLALTSSGGGDRAMLIGAGIVKALDDRDSDSAVSGLYQSMTYHAGLSGGSWLLTTLAGNNFDTISTLSEQLWEKTLVNNSLWITHYATAPEAPFVKQDMLDKAKAGFNVTVTEVWGRLIAWQLLLAKQEEEGTVYHLSDVRRTRAFRRFEGPYPIMTALGVEDINGPICDAADNATQYEFTPDEFGSWDKGVQAFTPTEFLGSKLSGGQPVKRFTCVRNFDDFGMVAGTSSTKFNEQCGNSQLSFIAQYLDPFVSPAQNNASTARQKLYARYPNPFHNVKASPKVSSANELYLVDGGQANQNNPIWPLLQPARKVDVVFLNDNSADTDNNWPNGTELLHTYQQAQLAGLTRMPPVPDAATFVNTGIFKRAAFFGCDDPKAVTIIWLPNAQYKSSPTPANTASSQFDYPANETRAMIRDGELIMTQEDDAQWPVCVACAVAKKASRKLPEECTACFDKYCWKK